VETMNLAARSAQRWQRLDMEGQPLSYPSFHPTHPRPRPGVTDLPLVCQWSSATSQPRQSGEGLRREQSRSRLQKMTSVCQLPPGKSPSHWSCGTSHPGHMIQVCLGPTENPQCSLFPRVPVLGGSCRGRGALSLTSILPHAHPSHTPLTRRSQSTSWGSLGTMALFQHGDGGWWLSLFGLVHG
jgi:hypothetical protein